MKKLIGVALATLFVAGIIANVAMADDRVQLDGNMRVRFWNLSYGNADDENFFDQRLRVGTTINVADGVKVVSRFDFADDVWGDTDGPAYNSGHFSESHEIQVDRAYLQVDKGIIGVSAGMQLISLGNAIAYDNNGTGIKLDIKTPVLITLGYTKETERSEASYHEVVEYNEDGVQTGSHYERSLSAALTDEGDDDTKDIDTWLIQLGYSADNFSVKGFYAAAVDGQDDGFEPNVVGFQGTFTTGMLSFNAELDIFGGDISGVDVMGTQFWGNVEAAVLDNLKVGLDLVWSDGNDEDDEIKITALNDWTDWTIMDRGPFNTDIVPGGASDVMDPARPFGTVPTLPVDIDGNTFTAEYGDQQGSIGGGVYAIFTPMEGLDITAQFMYLQPEEDDEIDYWDDLQVYSIGAEWFFAPNTSIAATYHKTVWSSDDYDENDDSADVVAARLQVNF